MSSGEDKKKAIFSNLLAKIKRVKHLDIILTVLFVAIILLIYFSVSSTGQPVTQRENKTSVTSEERSEENLILSYTKEIEKGLTEIISKLKDSGNVSVKVNLDGEIEDVIAYSTTITTNLDGSKVEVKSPVLITNDNVTSPIILQTVMPKIDSVVVVATGAKNTNVKLEIVKIIQALYEVESSKIEVFAGN